MEKYMTCSSSVLTPKCLGFGPQWHLHPPVMVLYALPQVPRESQGTLWSDQLLTSPLFWPIVATVKVLCSWPRWSLCSSSFGQNWAVVPCFHMWHLQALFLLRSTQVCGALQELAAQHHDLSQHHIWCLAMMSSSNAWAAEIWAATSRLRICYRPWQMEVSSLDTQWL